MTATKRGRRGRKASRCGKDSENSVEAVLSAYMTFVKYKEYDDKIHTTPIGIRQFPVHNPYTKLDYGRSDFLLYFPNKSIYVQVKSQNDDGSTDEKVCSAFDIATRNVGRLRQDEFWLVLLGIHWATKPALLRHCKVALSREYRIDCDRVGLRSIARVFHGLLELAEHLNNGFAEYLRKEV